jgi:hypothetical protein
MLTALVAVLALAGAPAGTNVVCNPTLQATELGDAYSLTITITSDGRIIPGTLDHIQLGTLACGALLYTSATPRERGAIRKLNPTVDFDQMVGIGLQVVLHESEHVALNSTDECLTEKDDAGEGRRTDCAVRRSGARGSSRDAGHGVGPATPAAVPRVLKAKTKKDANRRARGRCYACAACSRSTSAGPSTDSTAWPRSSKVTSATDSIASGSVASIRAAASYALSGVRYDSRIDPESVLKSE